MSEFTAIGLAVSAGLFFLALIVVVLGVGISRAKQGQIFAPIHDEDFTTDASTPIVESQTS